ncbi:cobalt transporter [Bosea caraganae]|uniref:Cobalt transporter n=1 Tax=Bosea caraganae TaxID=2763117 RepID=A0A370LCJ5_9HYPH|nr:CorA family divalent cation transporter [Bosea caraganae]RDJ27564.1 cobalt transporter [Bosea caraganae]RDJ29579.1 cobalt transporter [Bosea caraganae]
MNYDMTRLIDLQTQVGFIWAYRFDAEGNAHLLPREQMPVIELPENEFLWLHLDLIDNRAKQWISDCAVLPAEAQAVFLSHDDHQRLHHSTDFAWGVTFDQVREIDSRADEIGMLHWIIGENLLLTGRRQALQAARLTHDALAGGFKATSPVVLFERLIEYVIEDVAADVMQLTEDTDRVEDHILDDRMGDEARRLGLIRRRTVKLHRQLNGLHLLFRRFSETSSARTAPETVKSAAGRLLHQVDTMLTDVQIVQQRARLLQDEIAAKLTTQTNNHLYVLSILTATLMPATLITGLFGVNTKGLPFNDNDWGFDYVIILSILAGLAIYWLLRRKRMIH